MKTIVVGSLNTDLVVTGLKHFPKSGELVRGKELIIGPGGKSRNIADMIAHLAPVKTVAMVSRTVRDSYGLWKAPIDVLEKSGVNTEYVTVVDSSETDKLPAIAVIPVDEQGNNQIILLPGISDDFSASDIDKAKPLFEAIGANDDGVLVLTLECPLDTATMLLKWLTSMGSRLLFDPGGIEANSDINELIKAGIYLIKPNEHEAKILTGVDVTDFDSAKQAAQKLHEQGIENVLITSGADGAYLFTHDQQVHIPIPTVKAGNERDATGCGDQTMATVCAYVQYDKSLLESANLAIRAGTLQFYRSGIQPLTKQEIGSI